MKKDEGRRKKSTQIFSINIPFYKKLRRLNCFVVEDIGDANVSSSTALFWHNFLKEFLNVTTNTVIRHV